MPEEEETLLRERAIPGLLGSGNIAPGASCRVTGARAGRNRKTMDDCGILPTQIFVLENDIVIVMLNNEQS
jgi:hypothetical protein